MTAESPPTKSESNIDVVIRLMKQGGYILVAGGGVSELPEKFRSHPQVILWDDNKQGNGQKTVPSNTRAIVYNRWVSHALAIRLRNAATQLGIPTFAMLKTREIKEFLAEIIHEPVIPTEVAEEIELVEEAPVDQGKGYLTADELAPPTTMEREEGEMGKAKRGEMGAILAKLDTDPSESASGAATRLLPVLKKEYGITKSQAALSQQIRMYREKRSKEPEPRKTKSEKDLAAVGLSGPIDDFSEAEKLLREARSALDLMIEFIPKLRKQVELQKKRHEKLRSLLLDE